MLTRRWALGAGLVAAALAAGGAAAAQPTPITVYRISGCTCCEGWIAAMTRAGFAPKTQLFEDISPIWRRYGVPDRLSSCHMGLVGGYVTVGHVPPADVRRLLAMRPKAVGVVVPGMPFGSPGMESPTGVRERYDTLLLLPGGQTRIFAHHA